MHIYIYIYIYVYMSWDIYIYIYIYIYVLCIYTWHDHEALTSGRMLMTWKLRTARIEAMCSLSQIGYGDCMLPLIEI